MLSDLNVMSHYIKLWSCSLMAYFLLHKTERRKAHKYPSYSAMCVPRLLDGLHPFITLTLLLRPQLQRLLSIVTKHDEEVVLKREKIKREKLFISVTPRPNTSTTVSLYSTRCFGCSADMLAAANQTYGTDIWKHCSQLHLLFTLFSCPDSSQIKFHRLYVEQAGCTDRDRERETGQGRVGGSTHMTELFAR